MTVSELIEKLQKIQADGKGNAEVYYFNDHTLKVVKRAKVIEPHGVSASIILDSLREN